MHPWDVAPAEARAIQESLRERVERRDRIGRIRRVAGADVAFETRRGEAIAGVVLLSYPGWEVLERAAARRPLTFPYVPGLLSFREIPAILEALGRLRESPDVIFCDGQGYAHPRRFGLACHLGVLLDAPTIGCAKSRLLGEHREPGRQAGSWVPLVDQGERIGAVLRTRDAVRPLYISCGHRVSLAHAVRLALEACRPAGQSRVPLPTRLADQYVAQMKRQHI
jgi:deoxyribonuclease V